MAIQRAVQINTDFIAPDMEQGSPVKTGISLSERLADISNSSGYSKEWAFL